MIDLAVSLASGTPFLDTFDVLEPKNVLVITGESGKSSTRKIVDSIEQSKEEKAWFLFEGAAYPGDRLWLSFKIPRLSVGGHLEGVRRTIENNDIDVAFVDPAYLSLLSMDNADSATNMFAMGSLLIDLTELGAETETTVCLVHHTKKSTKRERYVMPELDDLSMAGFAAWARQWLLVARRERYRAGSGDHRLYLAAGGSAGHSGEFEVDIYTGAFEEPVWEPEVKDTETTEESGEDLDGFVERALEVISQHPEGISQSDIPGAAGFNRTLYKDVANEIESKGLARCETGPRGSRKFYPICPPY